MSRKSPVASPENRSKSFLDLPRRPYPGYKRHQMSTPAQGISARQHGLHARSVTANPNATTFRYASQLSKVPSCPPPASTQVVGFRIVFEKIDHPKNFKPLAILEPKRKVNGRPITDCCSGYGLSMYCSIQQLRAHVRAVLRTSPLFLKKVGDHYAEIQLSAADGRCSIPSGKGHFDFFEYSGFVATAAVAQHDPITP